MLWIIYLVVHTLGLLSMFVLGAFMMSTFHGHRIDTMIRAFATKFPGQAGYLDRLRGAAGLPRLRKKADGP